MPDDRLYLSMLLDFYGELLTPRQRECFDLRYNEDLSLSEIAESCGISRQGAWDNIRHASEALEKIEERTGLVRRFVATRERLQTVQNLLHELMQCEDAGEKAGRLAQKVAEEVQTLLKTED